MIFISGVLGNSDPQSTNDTLNDDQYSHVDVNSDQVYSSSTITETTPESIGMPQTGEHKPHHHPKHKNPADNIQSHTRSPVYEVVNQPCYSPGCGGGFGPQDAYPGNRWAPGRSRYGPYPRYYEPRRRGGYREYVPPPPGFGPSYGQPDYGYGPRGMPVYPPERFDRIGGYGRPPYDDYFLG